MPARGDVTALRVTEALSEVEGLQGMLGPGAAERGDLTTVTVSDASANYGHR